MQAKQKALLSFRVEKQCNINKEVELHPYLNFQLVVDGESGVLQSLDDRSVGVRKLCVLPHQSYRTLLQQPV